MKISATFIFYQSFWNEKFFKLHHSIQFSDIGEPSQQKGQVIWDYNSIVEAAAEALNETPEDHNETIGLQNIAKKYNRIINILSVNHQFFEFAMTM